MKRERLRKTEPGTRALPVRLCSVRFCAFACPPDTHEYIRTAVFCVFVSRSATECMHTFAQRVQHTENTRTYRTRWWWWWWWSWWWRSRALTTTTLCSSRLHAYPLMICRCPNECCFAVLRFYSLLHFQWNEKEVVDRRLFVHCNYLWNPVLLPCHKTWYQSVLV